MSGNGAEAEKGETETISDARQQIRNITAAQIFANRGGAETFEVQEGNKVSASILKIKFVTLLWFGPS